MGELGAKVHREAESSNLSRGSQTRSFEVLHRGEAVGRKEISEGGFDEEPKCSANSGR